MQGRSIVSVDMGVVNVFCFGRQCAIQVVSGAAVVQEEETSTGAGSKAMRVDKVEAGQESILMSADIRG